MYIYRKYTVTVITEKVTLLFTELTSPHPVSCISNSVCVYLTIHHFAALFCINIPSESQFNSIYLFVLVDMYL